MKNIKECRQKLLPTADLHRDRDLDQFKEHVRYAVNLLSDSSLPFEMTDDLQTNIGLVHKGWVQEKRAKAESPKTAKKEKLPNLVLDDENDLLDGDWESDAENP